MRVTCRRSTVRTGYCGLHSSTSSVPLDVSPLDANFPFSEGRDSTVAVDAVSAKVSPCCPAGCPHLPPLACCSGRKRARCSNPARSLAKSDSGAKPHIKASCFVPEAGSFSSCSCSASCATPPANCWRCSPRSSVAAAATSTMRIQPRTSISLTFSKQARSSEATKAMQSSGMGSVPVRKPVKPSRRSTRCESVSLRRRGPPTAVAATKSSSASGQACQDSPSFVRARKTHVNSCGFRSGRSCKHVGSNDCKANMRRGTAELPMAFCLSKAHRRLAMPCGWIRCRNIRDEYKRWAMAEKSMSWRAPRRENAQAVIESSCNLNSGSNTRARQPTSGSTCPFG
mmetsp:Transcript_100060/g.278766  ORF Transcript_100060/g.278766 Transcript_100060/m.278766 type:complete len:341 (-) Transcript_100060:909-1931(-)